MSRDGASILLLRIVNLNFSTRQADTAALISAMILLFISIKSQGYSTEYILSISIILLFLSFLTKSRMFNFSEVTKNITFKLEYIIFYAFPISFIALSTIHTFGVLDLNLRPWGMGAAFSSPMYIKSIFR